MSDERRIGDLTTATTLTAGALFYAQEPMEADPEVADKKIPKSDLIVDLGITANADAIADLAGASRTTETVYQNAQDITDLAGAGRTTETVKDNADDILNLAGAGRTTETVKANADALAAIAAYAGTYCRVSQDTAQTIANETDTTINFETIESNVGGHYNAATDVYTVPSTGLYLFTGGNVTASVAWAAAKFLSISLWDASAKIATLKIDDSEASITRGMGGQYCSFMYLPAATALRIRVFHNRGSNTDTSGNIANNYFSIIRIA
jgi:hypothetical protein